MTTRLPRITDYVDHWAHARPEREALVGDDVRLTYGQLRGEVDRCAAALVAGGVRHGDRVALLGDPRPESLVVFLATASVGGIWVGLNPKYTTGELAHVVRDSEPVVLFGMLDPGDAAHAEKLRELSELAPMRVVTRGRALQGLSTAYGDFADVDLGALGPQLERARAAVGPLDPAAMIYTSGSTGTPKGALVPHGGLAFCGSVQAGRWYGDAPRKLCDLPINHIGGLGDICTSVLAAGGTTVFMERFDAAGALRTVERERLTHLYCIPTQLLAAVRTPEWESCDLSSLEWILWGGAAAPLRLLETLAATGARLGTSYSLTESTGSVTYTDEGDPLELLAWSVGRVDPHYEVTLRREDGTTARAGSRARSSSAATSSRAATSAARRRRARRSTPTAGCTPATSRRRRRAATSASSAVSRRCSSRAATTSTRARSRRRWRPIRRSRWRPSSACRTSAGARSATRTSRRARTSARRSWSASRRRAWRTTRCRRRSGSSPSCRSCRSARSTRSSCAGAPPRPAEAGACACA